LPAQALNSKWAYVPKPKVSPRTRLFCFPFAGAGPSAFRHWPVAFEEIDPAVEVNIISLPGREFRISTPAIENLQDLIEPLAQAIEPSLDAPYCFFGYSVGALIAFELTRRLLASSLPPPIHLFVCGKRAPHLPLSRKPIHALPDEQLIQELKRFNGTPQEVLDNQQLMALVLPVLRADFSLNETYEYREGPALPCPITGLGGRDDPEASPEMIEAWKTHTGARFQTKFFSGGHFFVAAQLVNVLSVISESLSVNHPGVIHLGGDG
jgi:medium-chain acyl-[acyl-carrier-protein] hydrolase